MSFASALNQYCGMLGSTNRELADRCGISTSALSRYRSGDRAPEAGSATVRKLAEGIASLAREKDIVSMSNANELVRTFDLNLAAPSDHVIGFGQRLDALLEAAGISNGEAAFLLAVDPSYVSRVRNGSRTPADIAEFTQRVAHAVVSHCTSMRDINAVQLIVGSVFSSRFSGLTKTAAEDELALATGQIAEWLMNGRSTEYNTVRMRFFLEQFNMQSNTLEELYEPVEADAVSYGASRVRRQCFGKEQLREAELEFLWRSVEAGVSRVSVISDMPFSVAEGVPRFSPGLYRGLKALIEQGSRIVVVHDLNCSLEESMGRIELWMPLYLTGMVTSYCISGMRSTVDSRIVLGSTACVLSASSISGNADTCWAFLSNDPEDIAYHKMRHDHVMELASPLIEAFREDDEQRMEQFRALEAGLSKSIYHYDYTWPEYPNVSAAIYPYDCVVLTRAIDPVMHLVIRHPKLCRALYLLSSDE